MPACTEPDNLWAYIADARDHWICSQVIYASYIAYIFTYQSAAPCSIALLELFRTLEVCKAGDQVDDSALIPDALDRLVAELTFRPKARCSQRQRLLRLYGR